MYLLKAHFHFLETDYNEKIEALWVFFAFFFLTVGCEGSPQCPVDRQTSDNRAESVDDCLLPNRLSRVPVDCSFMLNVFHLSVVHLPTCLRLELPICHFCPSDM